MHMTGQGMEMPMSGEWIIRQHLESPVPGRVPGRGRYTVRTRVYWDGDRLALEHRAKAGGQVRAVLEIVDGRLQVTRSLRDSRIAALAPLVLVFDRDGGGE